MPSPARSSAATRPRSCRSSAGSTTATLQAIAAENNLSETAFFVGEKGDFEIRWMTPTDEVDLCGHATLAAAWVIFNELERAGARSTSARRAGRCG